RAEGEVLLALEEPAERRRLDEKPLADSRAIRALEQEAERTSERDGQGRARADGDAKPPPGGPPKGDPRRHGQRRGREPCSDLMPPRERSEPREAHGSFNVALSPQPPASPKAETTGTSALGPKLHGATAPSIRAAARCLPASQPNTPKRTS